MTEQSILNYRLANLMELTLELERRKNMGWKIITMTSIYRQNTKKPVEAVVVYEYEEGLVINTPDGKNPLAIFISPSSTRKLPLKLEGESTIWSTKEKDIDKIVQFFKYDRDQFRDTVENKIQSLVREYTDNKYLITVQEEKTDRFLHTSLFSIILRDRKTKYIIGFRFILKELLRPQIKDRIEEFLCHKEIYKLNKKEIL